MNEFGSWSSFRPGKVVMAMNAFHHLVAAISAVVSSLEHDLVLALPFLDFDPAEGNLTHIIGDRWRQKWRRVVSYSDPEAVPPAPDRPLLQAVEWADTAPVRSPARVPVGLRARCRGGRRRKPDGTSPTRQRAPDPEANWMGSQQVWHQCSCGRLDLFLLVPADHEGHGRADDEDGEVTNEVHQAVGDVEGQREDDDQEDGHLDQ